MRRPALRAAFLLAIALAGSLFCGTPGNAQSAGQIIDRHIKAIGGAKALRAVQSVRLEGTARVAGEDVPFVWMAKRPNLFYFEIQAPQAPWIEASNGRSAWREDSVGGLRTLSGREQARARATASFRNDRLLIYKKDKTRVNLLERQSWGDREVLVVEMTTPTGVARKLYFDRQSYLLLKEEQERDDGREEIFYSDYRAVDGVLESYRIEFRRGDASWQAAIQRVTHNAAVEDRIFDFPARAERPLPDISALLKAVEKNQEELDRIKENYTYTLVETNFEMDDKGRLKQKSENTYEVLFAYGGEIRKLVRKNGQPLSAGDQRKEEDRVVKLIEKYEKQHRGAETRKAKQAEAAAKGDGPKEEGDDDFGIDDFLRAAKITSPRRERFRGKDVIVFEFGPNPAHKPKNRAESLVQKLAGMLWVDEDARQVARLEARTVDSIRIGAGLLASLGKGAEFVFEQEMVNNEIWLPRYSEGHLSARVLLLASLKLHRIERYSDYKKFNVETLSEIKAPKPDKSQ